MRAIHIIACEFTMKLKP